MADIIFSSTLSDRDQEALEFARAKYNLTAANPLGQNAFFKLNVTKFIDLFKIELKAAKRLSLEDKYDLATPTVQAQVDALLG